MPSVMEHLDPCKQIGELDGLVAQLNRRIADLKNEVDGIALEWEGLCAAGGSRADHAAILMTRLQSHLCGMAHFCSAVDVQVQQMHENPFGRVDS